MPTSSPVSAELRQFAEAPDRYTDLSDDVERYANERVCIVQGPTWAAVSDVHVSPDGLQALVDEVRERVPPEKTATWWLGPSSEPADLHERLQGLGFVEPADRASLLHGLACTAEPPPGPPDVDVRRVESLEEFTTLRDIGWEGFGISEERREQERPHLQTMYDAYRRAGVPVGFIAYVNGEPVGVGRSVTSPRGVFLIGGAVLAHARGRGVYRALVRASWDDAVDRGTPAMITEAMPDTSYPVLLRLGFVEVCTIRRIQDAPRG